MIDDRESPMAVVVKHQKKPPVMLGPIAKELGIPVKLVSLGKSIAGQIMRDPLHGGTSGFSIWINSDESRNRQKFTLAHELAHYILHRDLIESGIVDDTMYRSELGSVYETQANQLAADILMPIRLIKKYREQNPASDFSELAKVFEVSEQAMKIRLSGMRFNAQSAT
ncbi:MAG: ImmA/IrrE family metallo-endopeptidase [Bradyrhizobium sp.]|uniref:ImmA/IrrE family metallo-endopeptidase n=1 Tax=Bradyrhizobium sp. TaxID=376 RepID=UPI0025C120C7|nr:ImmA/IrrE family metallo-endopeptidase [Bradyrhizobium sp.]MBI5264611.1 ImmA/IrrE family metallo-endopeptidase [Bradyrhizobium sp.]